MKIHSTIERLGPVVFPHFTGERIYMEPFQKFDGYRGIPDRWRCTVDMMLKGLDVSDLMMYLMVDQKKLAPGDLHRRPGVHIDGNWISMDGRHDGHGLINAESSPDLMVIATNREACRAFVGDFEGKPTEDGDCSHFDLTSANIIRMVSHFSYKANGVTLHESVPVPFHCDRTVVRINIPGWADIHGR